MTAPVRTEGRIAFVLGLGNSREEGAAAPAEHVQSVINETLDLAKHALEMLVLHLFDLALIEEDCLFQRVIEGLRGYAEGRVERGNIMRR